MNSGLIKIAHGLGGVLVVAGALFQFFDFGFANYIFGAGALMLIIVQAIYLSQVRNEDIRTQRIVRLMFLFTFLLGFGTYLMFTGDDRWVILLLIYAVVSVFLAWRAGGIKTEKTQK